MKNFFYKNIQKIFIGLCLGFVASAVILGVTLFPTGQGKLIAYFFDIGQGDAIYIRLPNEQDILIDGGPDKTILSKLGEAMPFYDREIDLVVLTHPHADHLVGLIDVLKNYKVKKIWMTGVLHTTDEYLTLLELVRAQSVETQSPLAGERHEFGDVHIEVLNPDKSVAGRRVAESSEEHTGGLNDSSIVLKLVYGENKFLFTGDMTIALEKELAERGADLDADILKVGHHGSKYSSSKEFVNAVSPEYAVIQVGRENRYGHPAYRVLKTLEYAGTKVFRNDLNGDIKIVGDGKRLKVKLERQ